MITISPVRVTLVFVLTTLISVADAFDNTCNDNLAIYWGQNSYGAVNPSDTANWQQPINFYCNDDTINVIPIAFVDVFFGTGGLPELDLANTCSTSSDPVFPGTQLPNCSFLASDIEACQAKGKIVTISLGGASGSVGFTGDAQGQAFADTIWNVFLGGTSNTRPFGSAVLDGVDLDIEAGTGTGYAAFVNQLRTHFAGASKSYYVSAAPQCPYPDASLGNVINAAAFDMIYVQFYNNPCGLQNFNEASEWDYGIWDYWARYVSPNPNVKIYIGAPASSTAAGSGYQTPASLANILQYNQKNFPSFGGAMMWDASQAYANNRYDVSAKDAMTAAGSCDRAFVFPACSAPAYVSGQAYTQGQQVSYRGYVWEAKYWASDAPASNPNGDWSAIAACSGAGSESVASTTTLSSPTVSSPATSTARPSSTSTQASTTTHPTTSSAHSTTSSTSSVPATSSAAAGSCAGVAAWNSQTAYTGGSQVSYNGYIWTANWWSQADPPGGSSGDWTRVGPCSGSTSKATTSSASTVRTTSTSTTMKTSTSAATSLKTSSSSSTSAPHPTSTTSHASSTTSRSTSTTSRATSSTSRSTSTTSSTAPSATNKVIAGSCAGVAAWNSQTAYTGGQQVTYNGYLWTAKWWSEADVPGGASGDWTRNGACTSVAGRTYI